MSYGHDNICAIGTTTSNAAFSTSFQSSYQQGNVHAEIPSLKQNIRDFRTQLGTAVESFLFGSLPSMTGNTSTTFDSGTKQNLMKFQEVVGITADGIYGQKTRNFMAAEVGVSSKGFVRLINSSYHYTLMGDTVAGLAANATYKQDLSWVTPSTFNTVESLAQAYYTATSKKIEVNNASLIDGKDIPFHDSHQSGKEIDFRNAGLTVAQEKAFLLACEANSNVQLVYFYTDHGLSLTKRQYLANHTDHFHVKTYS
ncbi:peptidoglycan-binding protein [Paenibacillus sp. strain BS8-2]